MKITSKEIETQFRKELQDLLDKFKAEIEVNEDGSIEVWIDSVYDQDGNCIQEYVDCNLGQYMSNVKRISD